MSPENDRDSQRFKLLYFATCHLLSFILSFFLLFYTKLLKHSLQTKALIELLHAQNDIAFVVVAPFSLFVCKLARVASFG